MPDHDEPAASSDVQMVPTPTRRVRRRDVMKGTVSVATGVAAAGYVSPALQGLGVPATLAASAPPPPPPGPLQGCTIGFWKNHPGDWVTYTPTDTVGSIFTLPADFSALSTDTLQTALDYSGGPAAIDKAKLLIKQAVAGVLNITAGLNYAIQPLSTLIADVNAALATEDPTTMTDLATQLDTDNSNDQNTPLCQ